MPNTTKFQTEEQARAEVMNIHDLFWKALGDRDAETRFSYCVDNVTFIGTGLNEKASNKAEYLDINKKGIEQYPQKFTLNFLWKQVSCLDDIAWVESEVEWELILDEKIEKEMIRNTVVLKKINDLWKIVHVHGSVPDYRYTGQNYMTNEASQKRNRELEMEVYKRTKELNLALEHLKNTQNKLIHAEKMASLGELTAGIAHEIQNPLNFVNNFSEVNKELLLELNEEIENGNLEEVKSLANNIIENEQKINHHGKRADAIVKGMLQHSRTSTGVKEPTDINALADEYLRLAYHGLRAKDKSFNATLKKEFDESIGNINIIPQDVGRVILNLITNAFYAVNEKQQQQLNGYDPTVSVITKKLNDHVEIIVKDNGMGISQQTIEKIFQPFFTTKPTGQGTGLGLSMSYDIIVKGHGGELIPESEEGVGTSFTIKLPNKF